MENGEVTVVIMGEAMPVHEEMMSTRLVACKPTDQSATKCWAFFTPILNDREVDDVLLESPLFPQPFKVGIFGIPLKNSRG